MSSLIKKAGGKVGEKLLDKVFDIIENIDVFDQLAEMIKTVVPCKLEVTVKGKKSLEVNVHGVKQGQLWISIRRVKPVKVDSLKIMEEIERRESLAHAGEPEEATEEEAEETEQAREASTE